MAIKKKVFKVIEKLSGEKNIDESLYLIQQLGMDSLQLVTMLIEIESVFDITLDEVDMNPFELQTVGEVVALVKKYKR